MDNVLTTFDCVKSQMQTYSENDSTMTQLYNQLHPNAFLVVFVYMHLKKHLIVKKICDVHFD